MQKLKEKDDSRVRNFFDEMNALFKKHEIYPHEIGKHVFLIKLENEQVAMITADKKEEKEDE